MTAIKATNYFNSIHTFTIAQLLFNLGVLKLSTDNFHQQYYPTKLKSLMFISV